MDSSKGREVFFEIVTIGAYAKISAIDAETGTEVSLMGPSDADEATLRAAALSKLDYVLKKKKEG